MSAYARRKGHQFERDICNMLTDELGIECRRVLEQVREKELGDIQLGPFVIECKRYKNLGEPPADWWKQAWAASQNLRLIPVLIWKFDRKPIKVTLPLSLLGWYPNEIIYTATTDWQTGMMVMREHLATEEQARQWLDDERDSEDFLESYTLPD